MVLVITPEPEEPALSPGGAPGVLYDPEVLSAFATVTNGENTVVEVGRAAEEAVVDSCRKRSL